MVPKTAGKAPWKPKVLKSFGKALLFGSLASPVNPWEIEGAHRPPMP